MNSLLEILKQHFVSLVASQGYVTEQDYCQACMGIDYAVAEEVGNWLAASGLKLKAIGPQYQQEVLEKVQSPNVNDVKDTKHHTDVNRDKKQKSRYPYPRRRRDAQLWSHNIDYYKQELKTSLERYYSDSANFAQYMAAADAVQTFADLQAVWDAVVRDAPPPNAPTTKNVSEPFKEYVDLPSSDEPPLELAHLKDPVEAHITNKLIANDYSAKIKRKVEFDNDVVFVVDTADTVEQKVAGLEVFDSLPQGKGLLFPFDPPSSVTFHMGKVKFPIDIIFLLEDSFGKNLIASKIVHEALPGCLDHFGSDNVRYVLELPGGTCKESNIVEGSMCRLSNWFEV